MNWQKAIDKINIEKFRIPAGWDTKEKIAEELQCSPDRVHDLLKVGLASGAFESQEFPVWDAKRRMTVRMRCYRQKPEATTRTLEDVTSAAKPVAAHFRGLSVEDRVKAAILRYPTKGNYFISKRVKGATTAMVAAARQK